MVGLSSYMGSAYSLMLNLSLPSIRGSVTAVTQVIINLLVNLGPLAVGAMSTAFTDAGRADGIGKALLCLLGLMPLGSALHLWVASRLKAPQRATSQPTEFTAS